MPRRNKNAKKGGARHSKGTGSGWLKINRQTGRKDRERRKHDAAPLTPGVMHSKTRIR